MDYSFGHWIKSRRKALDLTQRELADRVGCSLSAICKIESDARRPSRQVAGLLAEHLEIPEHHYGMFLKVARKEKAVDALEVPFPQGKTEQWEERPTIAPYPQENVQPLLTTPATVVLPTSPLIGREHELAAILQQIQNPNCRLLTLTGQGGVGKTHLAGHLGLAWEAKFPGVPAVFVNLTPITGREQTVTAIADALGIVLYSASDRASQLIAYLHTREQLLILDNFEHLLPEPGSTRLIVDILHGAGKVKIITTSREPLQIQAEWILEVQGLPVPSSKNPEELGTNSAVTLFIQRASQAQAGYQPAGEDMPAIARICELVEGLPLGIELAASWVRVLSCQEIAAEIQHSLDFLASSSRDIPERQRSIRATIEHSWKLLTDAEKNALSRLSVFQGGFNRLAAEEVAGAALPVLSALISKSLVRRVETGRFDMHELIRQYASDCLREVAEGYNQIQEKYSRFYANMLEEQGPALKGADRTRIVAELVADIPNLRQAWHWAATRQHSGEISQSADTLFWFYESRSNCREGVPLFDEAVASLQNEAGQANGPDHWMQRLALGQSLSYKGYFLYRQGKHPQGREILRLSLQTLQAIPEQDSQELQMAISNAMVFLGTVTSVMGDFAEGDRLLHEGYQIKRRINDLWGSAFTLRQIGVSAYVYQGDSDQAYEALKHSLEISQESGNLWSVGASVSQLGLVAYARGEYDQAKQYLEKGLEHGRLLEDRASIAFALDCLGLVAAAQGRFGEAQRLLEESREIWEEIGEVGSLAQTLVHFGEVLLKKGDLAAARHFYREALTLASQTQVIPVLLEALLGEAEIQLAEGSVESARVILSTAGQNPSATFATRRRAEKTLAELPEEPPTRRPEDVNGKNATETIVAIQTIVQEILNW